MGIISKEQLETLYAKIEEVINHEQTLLVEAIKEIDTSFITDIIKEGLKEDNYPDYVQPDDVEYKLYLYLKESIEEFAQRFVDEVLEDKESNMIEKFINSESMIIEFIVDHLEHFDFGVVILTDERDVVDENFLEEFDIDFDMLDVSDIKDYVESELADEIRDVKKSLIIEQFTFAPDGTYDADEFMVHDELFEVSVEKPSNFGSIKHTLRDLAIEEGVKNEADYEERIVQTYKDIETLIDSEDIFVDTDSDSDAFVYVIDFNDEYFHEILNESPY